MVRVICGCPRVRFMLETKQEKTYLVTVAVLIVILGIISLWRHPQFQYKDTTNYANLAEQQKAVNLAYQKYLDSLKVDPVASKELFQQLVTQEDIQKEVETELKVSQPVVPPAIDQKSIKLTNKSGQQAITDYLTNTLGPIAEFNTKVAGLDKDVFKQDLANVNRVSEEFDSAYHKISSAEVPKEALEMHKSLLTSYVAYGKFLDLAKQYAADQNTDPWPDVYQNYAVVNDSLKKYNTELAKFTDKYKLSSDLQLHYAGDLQSGKGQGFALIPTAHAIFGLGDMTITVGDIPSLIKDAIEQGLAASFSQFMGTFIQKFVDKIESNYKIANFMYYSDALVNGQYVDDYLNKYVSDNLDKRLVKNFIPQFNCGQQPQNLKPVFQAKANQYLGFDPESVSPGDPNYYQKISEVGNFLSSPNGWDLYYQDLAAQAKSEAEKAAEQELTSPGLKTPRDTINNNIVKSINSIVSSENSSLTALMQLGGQNARSFISGFVAQLVQNLMNNFVFRGVTNSQGQIGVLKEQPTCLAAAQIQLVLPTANTQYQQPPPTPSEDQLLQEACAKHPESCPPASVRGPAVTP
jgi:hypothetical protein